MESYSFISVQLLAFSMSRNVSTTTDPQDHSMYFVGNSVDGGRDGEVSPGGEINVSPYHLHFTGNSIALLPAFPRYDDWQSTSAYVNAMASGNFSGNTLLAGECGIVFLDGCTNALVLKNDFTAAAWRGLESRGGNGYVRNIQVLKNTLTQAKSYHIKMQYPDSGGFFLQKNIYTNGVISVDPFFDAAGSHVHMMR